MTLRTKLFVATTLVVLTLFGVSEWLSYRQTEAFLAQYKALLESGTDRSAILAVLEAEREHLFARVTIVRLLHAGLTVIAAILVLNALWYRVILSPIRALLQQMNLIGRGTWTRPIPVERKDEIGELTQTFNQLGEQLTFTVHQFATASKLSAMALIEQRLGRRLALARDHIVSIASLLGIAKDSKQEVPEVALRNLRLVAKDLNGIEAQLKAEFERELHAVQNGETERNDLRAPGLAR